MKSISTAGLRHLSLIVVNLEECVHFYTDLLGMSVEWQPDANNFYLTSGNDNLALHRAPSDFLAQNHQRLDHLGFILNSAKEVDEWHKHFVTQGIPIKAPPRTHRDGARSFYCYDPDGNCVQLIYHVGLHEPEALKRIAIHS